MKNYIIRNATDIRKDILLLKTEQRLRRDDVEYVRLSCRREYGLSFITKQTPASFFFKFGLKNTIL